MNNNPSLNDLPNDVLEMIYCYLYRSIKPLKTIANLASTSKTLYEAFKEVNLNQCNKEAEYYKNCHKFNVSYAPFTAIQHGLLYLIKRYSIEYIPSNALETAVKNGHMDIVEWLHENKIGGDIKTLDGITDIDSIKFIYKKFKVNCTTWAMDWAAFKGSLDVIKWIYDKWQKGKLLCGMDLPCTTDALYRAASNGHLDIIKWLYENIRNLFLSNTHASDGAALYGYLNVVKFLHGKGQSTEYIMNSAVIGGHFHIVKWLYKKGYTYKSNIIADAARFGHLEMLKWLYDNIKYDETYEIDVIDKAVYSGNLEVIKWLHENKKISLTPKAMDNAAICGHLHIVKWLHENRSEGLSMPMCTNRAMDGAAIYGHLDTVKYLNSIGASCTTHAIDQTAYTYDDNLEIIKYLHSIGAPCTTKAMDNAAKRGNIEILDWLRKNRREGYTIENMKEALNTFPTYTAIWQYIHKYL